MYSFDNGCVYQVVVGFVSFSYPLAVSYLAFEPFSACEASLVPYPVCWLAVEDYWTELYLSVWLVAGTKHGLFSVSFLYLMV